MRPSSRYVMGNEQRHRSKPGNAKNDPTVPRISVRVQFSQHWGTVCSFLPALSTSYVRNTTFLLASLSALGLSDDKKEVNMPKALSAYEQETIMTFVKVDSSHNRYHENVAIQGVRCQHE